MRLSLRRAAQVDVASSASRKSGYAPVGMTNLGVALFYGVLLVDDKVLGGAFALQKDDGWAGLQENPDNYK